MSYANYIEQALDDSLSVFSTSCSRILMHVCSVSVKRRHSVFDAQNFGQNAQIRKTVRQVDLGVDFKSRLEGLGSGRFHLGSKSNFRGVVCGRGVVSSQFFKHYFRFFSK